jgi:hypothetical protein
MGIATNKNYSVAKQRIKEKMGASGDAIYRVCTEAVLGLIVISTGEKVDSFMFNPVYEPMLQINSP